MAVRTGTQLKSDLTAVETALATAVATPSASNLAAIVTAAQTVEVNGRDSRAVTSSANANETVGSGFIAIARAIRKDVQQLQGAAHGDTSLVPATATARQLKRLQKEVSRAGAPFQAAKLGGTTT